MFSCKHAENDASVVLTLKLRSFYIIHQVQHGYFWCRWWLLPQGKTFNLFHVMRCWMFKDSHWIHSSIQIDLLKMNISEIWEHVLFFISSNQNASFTLAEYAKCLLLFCKYCYNLFCSKVSRLIEYFLIYTSDNVLEGCQQPPVRHQPCLLLQGCTGIWVSTQVNFQLEVRCFNKQNY